MDAQLPTMKEESASYDHTILVVDDSLTNLRIVRRYLEQYGFRVLVAHDGSSALERAQMTPLDLILLDVMMPGLNGFETCRRLKADERTRDIPVIFMTALSSTEDKVEGFQAGAVDYVIKPVEQAELLARVTTHLRLRDLAKGLQERNAQLLQVKAELEQANTEITRFNQQLEQKVLQRTEELRRAYQSLEKLDRAKTNFIDITAHELRTPLGLVKGYAELLNDDIQGERRQAFIANMLSGLDRLQDVITLMLDVAEVESYSLEPHKGPVRLADIVEKVCASFKVALQKRRLGLKVEKLASLPEIQADADALFKVFYHLVVNAIKYTPDGGAITISGQALSGVDGERVQVTVSDTGIGIDPSDHDVIFEKFYQAGKLSLHSSGRTKFKGGGPGLGLAIARGVVNAHGGQLWVESPGYDEQSCPGSQFHVLLPVKGTPILAE
jgi:signal transduction histidine kinase